MAVTAKTNSRPQTFTTTPERLFYSRRAGGSQLDGVLSLTLYNESGEMAYVYAKGFDEQDNSASPQSPIPAGGSLTLRISAENGNNNSQIDEVWACASSASVDLSWAATEHR